MAVQESTERGSREFVIEVGPISEEGLEWLLGQLEVHGEIERFRIEIESEEPVRHPLAKPTEELTEGATGAEEAARRAEPAEEPVEAAAAEPEAEESTRIPRLRPTANTFTLVKVLYDNRDEWLRTEQIVDALPAESGIDADYIGSMLWDLWDRGLVEKHPYEEDRRKSEYHISENGERAVEEAIRRRDESDESES